MMDAIQKKLLEQVADLHDVPQGAYSLRINGNLYGKTTPKTLPLLQKTTNKALIFMSSPVQKMRACTSPFCLHNRA